MRIFVTGDTHGGIDFNKLISLKQKYKDLCLDDYVIVAGDFGGVWNKGTLNKDLKKYVNLPFTVLFVDGNHENFDLLNSLPVEEWKGGKVHRVAENVLHLMRGQIYYILGKTFFVFGGA
ncbi:MAG: metallophosphoesterase, partial [Firmicutes bacterium]|nr:metallophosphoesterase [Bacillota bacterium]